MMIAVSVGNGNSRLRSRYLQLSSFRRCGGVSWNIGNVKSRGRRSEIWFADRQRDDVDGAADADLGTIQPRYDIFPNLARLPALSNHIKVQAEVQNQSM